MLGQVGTVLMGVSDTIMVGKLGTTELAATGIGNQIYFLFVVIGMGIMAAMAPMIAISRGADNKRECGEILRTGIELSFIISVILCFILIFIAEHFEMFGQPAEVTALARRYIHIIAISTIPLMLFLALKQFSDGLSVTKPAMIITIIGLGVNILFNWILIYGNLSFPAMGVVGAAIATLIARFSMAFMLMIYIFSNKRFQDYLPALISKFNTWPVLVKIFRIGIPGGMQLFFEIGAFSGAAILVGWLGTKELAAHLIALSLAAFTYMAASGISVAGSIRVGVAFGKGEKVIIMNAGKIALFLVATFMSICCAIFILFDVELVKLFINDPAVIPVAAGLVVIAGLFQLSDGIQAVSLGILRGIEDVNVPTLITLFAYWVIGLPVGYLLGFTLGYGVNGIWLGLLCGLSVSAILLTTRFFSLVSSGKTRIYEAAKLEETP